MTCETSTVVGLGFKKQPDADHHLSSRSFGDEALFQEPLVSQSAKSLDLCNNSNGGVLDNGIEVPVDVNNDATMDKLSEPQRAGGVTNASVSDDIEISLQGTQESNPCPSHHRFLDPSSGTVSQHICYELGDSEISESPKGDFGPTDNRVEASRLDEAVACGNNDFFPVKWTDIIPAVKCPWRIQIIDGTALIETSTSLEKEIEYSAKKEKRLVKTGKKKNNNSRATEEIVQKVCLEKNYEVYSRKELEALRFQGLDAQKRRWGTVYSCLGAALQKEYDGLVHFHPQLQEPQQQKINNRKKKKNVNQVHGLQFAKQRESEWATGIFGRHIQNIF